MFPLSRGDAADRSNFITHPQSSIERIVGPRILAPIHRLACVRIELRQNVRVRGGKAGLELSIALFTYADGWGWGFLHDPQASVRHDCSLAHPVRGM